MHRREIPVRSPCHRSIADMKRVDDGVRWCPSCEHEVHDLGELDEEQARALLRAHRGRSLCVRYATDREGRLRFASPPLPANRLVRRPRLAGFALAAAVSLVLIAGCASTRTSTQPSVDPSVPIEWTDPWAVEAEPVEEILMGMVIVIEEPFPDPEVMELEDDIIPEVISRSIR